MLEDVRRIVYVFLAFTLLGIIASILPVLQTHSWASATTPLLWALSCLATGGLTGFLFGIPRTLQADRPAPATGIGYRQHVNTNLEQISDWLTKIIVGVGLIQIRTIAGYVDRLAQTLAAGMGGVDDHFASALALIVYFEVIGFLAGYLSTRLFLAGAFSRADQAVAIVQEFKSLAQMASGDVLKQVLLKTKAQAFITGEPSFQDELMAGPGDELPDVDEEPEGDDNEAAALDQTLERLTGRVRGHRGI